MSLEWRPPRHCGFAAGSSEDKATNDNIAADTRPWQPMTPGAWAGALVFTVGILPSAYSNVYKEGVFNLSVKARAAEASHAGKIVGLDCRATGFAPGTDLIPRDGRSPIPWRPGSAAEALLQVLHLLDNGRLPSPQVGHPFSRLAAAGLPGS